MMDNNGSFVKVGSYKGHPTLSIHRGEDDPYPFTFGVAKAKLIVGHVAEIVKFVEDEMIKDSK